MSSSAHIGEVCPSNRQSRYRNNQPLAFRYNFGSLFKRHFLKTIGHSQLNHPASIKLGRGPTISILLDKIDFLLVSSVSNSHQRKSRPIKSNSTPGSGGTTSTCSAKTECWQASKSGSLRHRSVHRSRSNSTRGLGPTISICVDRTNSQ